MLQDGVSEIDQDNLNKFVTAGNDTRQTRLCGVSIDINAGVPAVLSNYGFSAGTLSEASDLFQIDFMEPFTEEPILTANLRTRAGAGPVGAFVEFIVLSPGAEDRCKFQIVDDTGAKVVNATCVVYIQAFGTSS